MRQFQIEAKAAGGGIEHAQPLGRGFLADTIAWDDGDVVLAGHGASS